MINILGEEFEIEQADHNSFFILHPKWSVLGWGITYKEAHSDLLDQIEVCKTFYKDIPNEDLTEEGLRLKQWLMTIKITR